MTDFDRTIRLGKYPSPGVREARILGGNREAVGLWLTEGHISVHTFITPDEAIKLGRALLHAAEDRAGVPYA